MDLNELWNELKPTPTDEVPEVSLDAAADSASVAERIVAPLRQRVRWSLYTNGLLTLVALGAAGYYYPALDKLLLFGVPALVGGLYTALCYRTYVKMEQQVVLLNESLQESLTAILAQLKQYIALETRINQGLLPFSVFLGAMIQASLNNESWDAVFRGPIFWTLLVATLLFTLLAVFVLLPLWYKKMYGTQIADLQTLLKNLQDF